MSEIRAVPRAAEYVHAAARRRWHTVLLAFLLCLSLVGVGGLFYYRSLNSRIRRDDGYYFPEEIGPEKPERTDSIPADLGEVDESRLEQALRAWAKGEGVAPLEDRNVLNILLCGVDTQTGDARGGPADAILLVSVNRKRRTVALTSILRDSCSYIDLSLDPKNPRAELGRVAAAHALGGPATLMETLSADYKIHIDDYVCVDFSSFPKVIDALGGVTLDVSRAEAGYINRTVPGVKGQFPWGGAVRLTGEQALLYSRVSQADGDRAARQQRLLLAILDSARQSSPGEIVKALTRALRQVRTTSLTENDVTDLAKEALTQGWLNYSITQLRTPVLSGEEGAAAGLSADVNGRRMWIVDYAREAPRLQEAIYGYTNIEDGKGEDYVASLFK